MLQTDSLQQLVKALTVIESEAQQSDLISQLADNSAQNGATTIGFVNAHAANLAAKDETFGLNLRQCDYLLRDGSGMKILYKLLGKPEGLNMNGTDFIPQLIKGFKGKTVALMGTEQPYLDESAKAITAMGAQIVTIIDGFQPTETYLEAYKTHQPDLTILAMGMPKQEAVAAQLSKLGTSENSNGVVVCGGAVLDFMGGKVERAPELFRKFGCEWLYRLAQEPKRLFKRYLVGNAVFLTRSLALATKKRLFTSTQTAGSMAAFIAVLLLGNMLSFNAQARDIRQYMSEAGKAYMPKPVTAGSFELMPAIIAGVEYNDNIFATDGNEESDVIAVVTPTLRGETNWDRHEINFELTGDSGFYADNGSEDYLDYSAGIGGRLDLPNGFAIPLNVKHLHGHYDRTSTEDFRGVEPTEFDRNIARTGVTYEGAVLRASATVQYENYDFEDGVNRFGFPVDNQLQNRNEITSEALIGLSENGRAAPYVYGNYKELDFDQLSGLDNLDRDAETIELGVGSKIEISPITLAQFRIGIANRDTADSRVDDKTNLNYSAMIDWYPTKMIALHLQGDRTLDATIVPDASVSIDHELSAAIDYEFQPQWMLNGGFTYLNKDFEGLINQELSRYTTDLGVTYKLSRHWWAALDYRNMIQRTDSPTPLLREYDRNTILLSTTYFY